MKRKRIGVQNSLTASADHVHSNGGQNRICDAPNKKRLSLPFGELKISKGCLSNGRSRRGSDVAINKKMIANMLNSKISPIEKPSGAKGNLVVKWKPSKPVASTPELYKSLPVADTVKRTISKNTGSGSNRTENNLSRSFIEDSILSNNNGSFLNDKYNKPSSIGSSPKNLPWKKVITNSNETSPKSKTATSETDLKQKFRKVKFKMPELSPRETLESKGDECFSPVLQRDGLEKSYPENGELLETESGSDCDNDQLNEKTQHVLEGVVAFVDVRSNHDNRSAGVGKVLERLGATVVKKLIPEITHVVFSNGLQSTLNHVDKYNAQFVSVLWVDSCMKSNCRVDEHLYPASRVDAISPMPMMRGKSKRLKSMQPKPFENGVDNSKIESKRKKRNIPKDKMTDSPFAYISLEDIEMKDLSKKMKDHDAHFYSPISTGSPFFNQVMKKLSEKRASLGESPECTRNRTSAKKETLPFELGNKVQAMKNKEDQHADDNVFAVDSCVGFEKIPFMQDLEPAPEERQTACRKICSDGVAAQDSSKPCEPEEEEDWPTPLDCEPMDLSPKLERAVEVSANEIEENSDTHGLNYHATKKATDDCVGNSKNLDAYSCSKPLRKKKKLLSKSQMLTSILNSSSRNNGDEKALESAVSSSERFDNQQREKKIKTKRKRQQEISPRKRQKGNDEISCNKNEFFDGEKQMDVNENAVQMDTDADNDDRQSEVDEANHVGNEEGRKISEKERYNGKKKRPKGCLVMTSLHFSQQDFIRNAVKTLGSFVISKSVNSSTTHVISGSGRRTLNILNGIAHGCWILSPNWINCSYDEGHWLNEEGFELVDVFQTAMKNRCSRLATGRSLSSELFENEDPFYIAEDTVPPKAEIIKLIRKCGGQVTSNVSKAKICIGKHQQTELHCVEENWLLDCIMNTEVLSTDDYIIGKPGST